MSYNRMAATGTQRHSAKRANELTPPAARCPVRGSLPTQDRRRLRLHNWKWSDAEKKLARSVYEGARLAELDETLSDFKAHVAALEIIDDMWPLEEYLRARRHALEDKYTYRYSGLGWLFARLIREGRVKPAQLAGLSEEKRREILRMAAP